ncbi:MAG: DUF3721 domain-containing protein [Cyanobacteriota bacterium]|jgi:hypothetical protein
MDSLTPSLPRPSSRLAWRALSLLLTGLAPWLALAGSAHMRGMHATRAEAEKRAAELKCKGTFAMGTLWMPCANERQLHDALQKAQ